MLRIVLFLISALLCEVMGTIGGFGSSVFFVPVAQLFYSFNLVLAITGLMHVFSNTSKLFFFYKHVNYRLLFYYGIPSVAFVIAGAYLTTLVAFEWSQFILGLLLVTFSLLLLFFENLKLPASKSNAFISGSLAGFTAGFNGTGGVIRGISMAAFSLSKETFVATSAAIDFGVDLSRSVVYIDHGYFDSTLVYLIPLLMVVSFLGTYIGKLVLNKINEVLFKKIVLFLVLTIGVVLTYNESMKLFFY